MRRVYKSAVDWWYYLLMIGVPIAVIVPALLGDGEGDIAQAILVGTIVFAFATWLLLTTEYVVDEGFIHVQSGPFKWEMGSTPFPRTV